MKNFEFGIDHLTVDKVVSIANRDLHAGLSAAAVQKINQSQQHVQQIVKNGETVYGINTGFGALSNKKISERDTRELQHKILQSHSVGVGEAVPSEIARLSL